MALLSINLETDVEKGTLSLDQDGSFTYTFDDGTYTKPNTDFFTYSITDERGTSNIARVDIEIQSTGPAEGGELRLNGTVIPDMMVGNTRVAEAWLNGVKVFDNANY